MNVAEEEFVDRSSGRRPLRFLAYERAERRLYDAVFWETVETDPFLSQMEFTRSEHVGPIRVIAGDDPYDTQMQMHGGLMTISTGSFVTMDFVAFVESARKAANDAVGSLKTMAFGHVGAISDRVGNTVDGTDKTPIEALKEFFMRVEIDFDDDGAPRWPTLVGPPGHEKMIREVLAALDDDPEIRQRITTLRSKFLGARPKRRLLSPC